MSYYNIDKTGTEKFTDTVRIDIDERDAEVLIREPSYDTVRAGRVYQTRVRTAKLEAVEPGVYRLPSGKLLRVANGSPEGVGTCRYVEEIS